MSLQINTHNIALSSELKLFIEETIEKALKGVITPRNPQVEITQNTHHRKGALFSILVHIPLPHKVIHAEARGVSDIRAGMHAIKEKLERQIEKYKNK